MTGATPRGDVSIVRWLLIGQWRAQPGRLAAAALTIAIGVALALAIELVNRSALAQFGQALAVINGRAHASLVARGASFDEALFDRILADRAIRWASPVLEARVQLRGAPLTLIGLDPMRAAPVTPALLPAGGGAGSASTLFDDDALFLSNAVLQAHGLRIGDLVELRYGTQTVRWRVAGSLPGAAAGQSIGVIDIGAAQWRLGALGRLSRIDLRLAERAEIDQVAQRWRSLLPADIQWVTPEAGEQRASNLSRAYRVNLSVLALVALFTGGFIVHATIALAIARQSPQLALLAVLGASSGLLRRAVLAQALLLGVIGALFGVLLGLSGAAILLRQVGADLGGGYFAAASTPLSVDPLAPLAFAGLGVLTALLGALGPVVALRAMVPAQALRVGLDEAPSDHRPASRRVGLLVLASLGLMLMPAWRGLPLAAYLAIAALLFAGILMVRPLAAAVGNAAERLAPLAWRSPAAWLAIQRLRAAPPAAAAALSGVVASFALASAMTVMVDSFRHSVSEWLVSVLPADLYGRGGPIGTTPALGPQTRNRLAGVDGVAGVELLHSQELSLDPTRPRIALLARELPASRAARVLPLTGEARPATPGRRPAWVSEAMVDLYQMRPGATLRLPLAGGLHEFEVLGVWRDYARQHGAVVIDQADLQAITGDHRANDVAMTLRPGADEAQVVSALRAAAPELATMEIRSARDIRALSLRIFDRSFAITRVLEAIAIVIGLFGVASTYTGQALARAREFGVLRHLGVTARAVVAIVAIEAALLIAVGVAWGALLGGLISLILVYRVNPQSFHWTMDIHWPMLTLITTGCALILVGVMTAVLAARSVAGRSPVLAVRQDW